MPGLFKRLHRMQRLQEKGRQTKDLHDHEHHEGLVSDSESQDDGRSVSSNDSVTDDTRVEARTERLPEISLASGAHCQGDSR